MRHMSCVSESVYMCAGVRAKAAPTYADNADDALKHTRSRSPTLTRAVDYTRDALNKMTREVAEPLLRR